MSEKSESSASHLLWVELEYKCERGHTNKLGKFFLSGRTDINHTHLMPYLPRQWPCAHCASLVPFVEISLHWLTDEQAKALGTSFLSSTQIIESSKQRTI
jgi:hypothetical protein